MDRSVENLVGCSPELGKFLLQKPVGAKTVRVQKPVIKAYCISDDYKQTVTFRTMTDINNFSNPSAPGALVAAVLVCADVVDPNSASSSLQDQLLAKFNGGFKIYYWSNVPQGSGVDLDNSLSLHAFYSGYCRFGNQQHFGRVPARFSLAGDRDQVRR